MVDCDGPEGDRLSFELMKAQTTGCQLGTYETPSRKKVMYGGLGDGLWGRYAKAGIVVLSREAKSSS